MNQQSVFFMSCTPGEYFNMHTKKWNEKNKEISERLAVKLLVANCKLELVEQNHLR
jgi:hypothetical protein